MTSPDYEEIREIFIEQAKHFIENAGQMIAHITVYANHKNIENNDDSGKPSIIHIPIPPDSLKSEESKDEFIHDIMPGVAKEIRKKFDTQAVGWASEAWLRTAHKDDPDLDNWKDMPIKKEVLILILEAEGKSECIVYEMKRNGQKVNSDGDLIDDIQLEELKEMTGAGGEMAGRFFGLYKLIK